LPWHLTEAHCGLFKPSVLSLAPLAIHLSLSKKPQLKLDCAVFLTGLDLIGDFHSAWVVWRGIPCGSQIDPALQSRIRFKDILNDSKQAPEVELNNNLIWNISTAHSFIGELEL
jgi:hypothetical protein